ncbi:MAG TPA: M23 family metallopeptidase [Gammaproteobacteria bacterium]|nr:M23 family metallopeptidase [Gammaproteobacteria bacterium]
MNQIIITNRRTGKNTRLYVGWGLWLSLSCVVSLFVLVGVSLGQHMVDQKNDPALLLTQMEKELAGYQQEMAEIKTSIDENMNALAQRLAISDAQVIRLNALGERLIEKAELDKGEFDFQSDPSVGGPDAGRGKPVETISQPDFSHMIETLDEKLKTSALQLKVLESLLLSRDLQEEIYPEGRPIKQGWISSYFGYRADPFTGRRTHHDGIDLAGKRGSDVIAVASGLVTFAGKRHGYGNLVEINHGNGYITRYGHNQSIDVKRGDRVKKGQAIARMGSSGRSTGPHVHFEVHKNGRAVDPMKYVKR